MSTCIDVWVPFPNLFNHGTGSLLACLVPASTLDPEGKDLGRPNQRRHPLTETVLDCLFVTSAISPVLAAPRYRDQTSVIVIDKDEVRRRHMLQDGNAGGKGGYLPVGLCRNQPPAANRGLWTR